MRNLIKFFKIFFLLAFQAGEGAYANSCNEIFSDKDLIRAIKELKPDIARILIEKVKGIDLNLQDKVKGQTALMWAIEKYEIKIAQLLIEGENIKPQNPVGNNILNFPKDKTKANIESQNPVGNNTLNFPKDKTKANIESQNPVEKNQTTEKNQTEIKLSFRKKVDLNLQNIEGQTALMMAIIRSLIDADVRAIKNGVELTRGQANIAEILIKKGVNLNLQDKKGDTALMMAIIRGLANIAELLIKKGADITLQNTNGETALTLAIYKNQIKIIKLLIKKGAKLNLQNIEENIAFNMALYNGQKKIVKLLIEKGALDLQNLNLRNAIDENTALSLLALYKDKIKIFKPLIEKESDLKLKYGDSYSALIMNTEKEQKERKKDRNTWTNAIKQFNKNTKILTDILNKILN